jgi:hypothetical protein
VTHAICIGNGHVYHVVLTKEVSFARTARFHLIPSFCERYQRLISERYGAVVLRLRGSCLFMFYECPDALLADADDVRVLCEIM